jgi:L-rhamnose mutarotase
VKSTNQEKKAQVIRRAFTLRLKPESFAKYKLYHDNIWPELVREIEGCGIAQITTFENNLQLFLYSEIYDEKAWDKLWSSKIHDKWAELMQPLMQFGADGKVDAGPLREIFHLETAAGKPRQTPKPKSKWS